MTLIQSILRTWKSHLIRDNKFRLRKAILTISCFVNILYYPGIFCIEKQGRWYDWEREVEWRPPFWEISSPFGRVTRKEDIFEHNSCTIQKDLSNQLISFQYHRQNHRFLVFNMNFCRNSRNIFNPSPPHAVSNQCPISGHPQKTHPGSFLVVKPFWSWPDLRTNYWDKILNLYLNQRGDCAMKKENLYPAGLYHAQPGNV